MLNKFKQYSNEQVQQVASIIDPDAFLSREDFILEYGTAPAWSSQSQMARKSAATGTACRILALVESWNTQ